MVYAHERSALALGSALVLAALSCGQLAGIHDIAYQASDAGKPSGGSSFSGSSAKSGSGGTPDAAEAGGARPGDGGQAGAGGDATGAAGTDSYAAVVLSDAPSAYYRFGEASGLVASDAAGENDGAYSAAILGRPGAIAGDSDTAAGFDGSSTVYLGDVFDFVGMASYSLEMWVKPAVIDQQTRRIFSKSKDGPGYLVVLNEHGLTQYRNSNTPDDTDVFVVAWHGATTFTHVVYTFDGASLKLYLNGVEAGSQLAYVPLVDTSYPLEIGEFFEGELDELAVYEHALTSVRVKAHYRVGSGS